MGVRFSLRGHRAVPSEVVLPRRLQASGIGRPRLLCCSLGSMGSRSRRDSGLYAYSTGADTAAMSLGTFRIPRRLLPGLLIAASASAQLGPSVSSPSPAAAQASPVATAYLALVRSSIVPADPRTVASAALRAMTAAASDPDSVLPDDFGRDADRDSLGSWNGHAAPARPGPSSMRWLGPPASRMSA